MHPWLKRSVVYVIMLPVPDMHTATASSAAIKSQLLVWSSQRSTSFCALKRRMWNLHRSPDSGTHQCVLVSFGHAVEVVLGEYDNLLLIDFWCCCFFTSYRRIYSSRTSVKCRCYIIVKLDNLRLLPDTYWSSRVWILLTPIDYCESS